MAKPHNKLVEAALRGGATAATSDEIKAEQDKTHLVFHLPATSARKKSRFKKKP